MQSMFMGNKFNQDIGNWDVSQVINMRCMFYGNKVFNQDIGRWDVSNVTDMSYMFAIACSFDQDISNWNVSKVRQMIAMFFGALKFNQSQNLSKWTVKQSCNMDDFSTGMPEQCKPKVKSCFYRTTLLKLKNIIYIVRSSLSWKI
jgi:surface protein